MMQAYLMNIVEQFNTGKQTVADARRYMDEGYQIICGDGKVSEIMPPFSEMLSQFVEETK